MKRKMRLSREAFVRGALIALFLSSTAVSVSAQTTKTTGSMMGYVFGEDMKTPAENAVVILRSLKDGKEYKSTPADRDGLYKIPVVDEGRYVVGVTTGTGNFNFQSRILIKPNELAILPLTLKAGAVEGPGAKEAVNIPEVIPKPVFEKQVGFALFNETTAKVIANCLDDNDDDHHHKPKKSKHKHD